LWVILTSSTNVTPQAVEVAPALILQPQASFPAPQQGMLVMSTDGKLYIYSYGWAEVKIEY
jgi:hypothetical protein